MGRHYILDDEGKPKLVDLLVWAEWFGVAQNRIVQQDEIGDVRVSTVFLGLDSNWHEQGDPVLWETMIFGGKHDNYQDRYSSLEDAKAGHAKAVALVKEEPCNHSSES